MQAPHVSHRRDLAHAVLRRISFLIVIVIVNVIVAVVACAHTRTAVRGVDVADLSAAEDTRALDVVWSWQPARFLPDGSAAPPSPDRWLTLAPHALAEPRGGERLSLVWYRSRLTLTDALAGERLAGRSVHVAMSIDDYGEILVDGELRARADGFNREIVAELTSAAVAGEVHELLVLGVNAPLGRPPARPMFRNEVFIRRPMRLVLDAAAPPTPPAPSGLEPARPRAECAVRIAEHTLAPTIEMLDEDCAPPTEPGPRWLRYEISWGTDELERDPDVYVVGEGYAEIWLDGEYLPTFRSGAQQIPWGAFRVDVLAWPAPMSGAGGSGDVHLARSRDH